MEEQHVTGAKLTSVHGVACCKCYSFFPHFKGTISRYFLLVFFFMNPFPLQVPGILNFFENSRRCSQVKVHHRVNLSTTPVASWPLIGVLDTGGHIFSGIYEYIEHWCRRNQFFTGINNTKGNLTRYQPPPYQLYSSSLLPNSSSIFVSFLFLSFLFHFPAPLSPTHSVLFSFHASPCPPCLPSLSFLFPLYFSQSCSLSHA